MSKTLILTSTVPGSGGVGDIYIKNIISGLNPSDFVRISIVKKNSIKTELSWEGIDSNVTFIGKSHYPILSTYNFLYFLHKKMKLLVDDIIAYIQREKINKIWVTLSSPEIIMIVSEIKEKLDINIYSTIWDVPEYLLQNNNFDHLTKHRVKKTFNDILEYSKKISVIDEGMRQYLPQNYRSKSIVIRNGVTFTSIIDEENKDESIIKIAFAGSIYAKKEWNALVRSLISCDFIINEKRVELICIGRLPRFGIIKDNRINFMPFMPNEDVLRILANCDIGYVPYWFSKRKQLIVSTSFPGKIASYLSVSLKIMFHGPSSSSVKYFIDKYTVGKCCHSLSGDKIMQTISDIDNLYVEEKEVKKAKNIFDTSVMINDFKRFII